MLEALKNIWRNKFLSLATIFVTGIIIFIFNVIFAINSIAEDAVQSLAAKVDLTINLKESTNFEEAESLGREILDQEGVLAINYIPKEQALEEFKKVNPDLVLTFEKYGIANPLPDVIQVQTEDPKFHQDITDFLSAEKYRVFYNEIIGSGENNAESSRLDSASQNLRQISEHTEKVLLWLTVTFFIGGGMIVLNSIQITIFNRRKEINVMNLVGAKKWTIQKPFIIEAIIYGILAFILSFIAILIFSKNISFNNNNLWETINRHSFGIVLGLEALITIVINILSAMIAIHLQIKNKILE